jgi:hypothetical protein
MLLCCIIAAAGVALLLQGHAAGAVRPRRPTHAPPGPTHPPPSTLACVHCCVAAAGAPLLLQGHAEGAVCPRGPTDAPPGPRQPPSTLKPCLCALLCCYCRGRAAPTRSHSGCCMPWKTSRCTTRPQAATWRTSTAHCTSVWRPCSSSTAITQSSSSSSSSSIQSSSIAATTHSSSSIWPEVGVEGGG